MKKIIIVIKKARKHIRTILREFFNDSCIVRASGLAYSTLLAIVPFITVIYAFGGFNNLGKSIESALLEYLLPMYHQPVVNALDVFTKNSLTTGALGTIGFLLTTLFLFNTVARNFDAIWGIESKSSVLTRFATYTAILVFGSLLIGASNSLTENLERIILAGGIREMESYKVYFSKILPYVASLGFFFVLMVFIPSTKVRILPGFLGSLVSWVLFELSKILFKLWVVSSVRNSIIYGSLAVIPIFLVGLYLVWLIILIGVETTFYVQNRHEIDGGHLNLSIEDKIGFAIDVFLGIGQGYRDGKIVTRDNLCNILGFSPRIINNTIDKLLDNNLILDHPKIRGGLIPAISMDKLYYSNLVFAICGSENKYLTRGRGFKNSKLFFENGVRSIDSRSILEILGNSEEPQE